MNSLREQVEKVLQRYFGELNSYSVVNDLLLLTAEREKHERERLLQVIESAKVKEWPSWDGRTYKMLTESPMMDAHNSILRQLSQHLTKGSTIE